MFDIQTAFDFLSSHRNSCLILQIHASLYGSDTVSSSTGNLSLTHSSVCTE